MVRQKIATRVFHRVRRAEHPVQEFIGRRGDVQPRESIPGAVEFKRRSRVHSHAQVIVKHHGGGVVGVVVVASLWGAREGAYGADGAEGTFRETPTAANRHLPSVELRGGGCA